MLRARTHDAAGQSGFAIVETMVASVLLLVGMAATLTVLVQASSTTVKSRTREQATNLQRELVEAARSVSYDALTPNGVGTAIRDRPALDDSATGTAGWTIRRRNVTYTVSVGVCTVDDPRDGTGPLEGGTFCSGSSTPPTPDQCAAILGATTDAGVAAAATTSGISPGECGIDANLDGTVDGLVGSTSTTCSASTCTTPPDPNPADYKRIVSLVRWNGGHNLQTSQINNPGLSAAPSVTSLTPATLSVTDTRSSLSLTATASNDPTTMVLYLDGTAIGNASPTGGVNWAGNWTMGAVTTTVGAQPATGEVVDGSYQLSAKAFDEYGQYGATRSQTIVVNRRQHFAPARVEAGRNGAGVEVEWNPPKEHDSEGFKVERRIGTGGAWVEACARARRTACRDASAPAPAAGQVLQYSVVGYDKDAAGNLRAGDRSEVVTINDTSPEAAPGTPQTLSATLTDGNVVLTWTAPAGGVVPDHYNIYRDGTAYVDRLERAYFSTGQALRFVDTGANGVPHTYYVTAVNAGLLESAPVGPVTR